MKKKSFVLYTSYREAVRLLTDEEAGILFKAIFDHEAGEDERIPAMDDLTRLSFLFIRQNLDENAGKYEKACEKRRERAASGQKKAGAAPEEKEERTVPEKKEDHQSRSSLSDIDNRFIDYENGNDIENEFDYDFVGEKEGALTGTKEKGVGELFFDRFWELYPKKVAKVQARKAWENLSFGDYGAILKKLPAFIESGEWLKEGGRYIPYPSTWLNKKGWEESPGP